MDLTSKRISIWDSEDTDFDSDLISRFPPGSKWPPLKSNKSDLLPHRHWSCFPFLLRFFLHHFSPWIWFWNVSNRPLLHRKDPYFPGHNESDFHFLKQLKWVDKCSTLLNLYNHSIWVDLGHTGRIIASIPRVSPFRLFLDWRSFTSWSTHNCTRHDSGRLF